MDKILLNNLHFYGFHGVLEAEKELGQKFIISIELLADLSAAGKSDNQDDTVSYHSIFIMVKEIVENRRYDLIEALGHHIATEILEKYNLVDEVKVTVLKPEAPVRGFFDSFGVEICRKR